MILRKISGPVDIENIWRIRNNMEIDNLIEGADTVRFIVAKKKFKWLGHIQRMDRARPTGKLLYWRPYGDQTSRETKTTMARGCYGRSVKAES
jgi:hypothetical protein